MKTFLVHADLANPVLDHAARDITWMVEATTAYRVMVNEPARDSAITVQLKIMPELPKYTFEICPAKWGGAVHFLSVCTNTFRNCAFFTNTTGGGGGIKTAGCRMMRLYQRACR